MCRGGVQRFKNGFSLARRSHVHHRSPWTFGQRDRKIRAVLLSEEMRATLYTLVHFRHDTRISFLRSGDDAPERKIFRWRRDS